ncbi:ABC transporter ATP-binding protein [Microbacterium sp.]|uniref:ABC transporter ATP-binding protein n=1 Tax=Microbacterium sp. TaxID=51671 RepID=UPI00261F37AC|nr:ABC transporter ATP-binding protein [Microbacterium sp.]MCV0332982.1 ABC transporter ATP-binding protein/permease [Microbacterium sp.]MCV0375427.1 ABC transporter ATP-binding protein/permease [Microbacterium sp.]MCV0389217.1 ABC transporter ATP-binding protein/permease [Microbacterium sp.]MCV0417745.1 ABC transporter ATP-binding protein/permease [Microbacterium sp.]MCV0421057.1 ABC transporter ATP-binding protein/permease [Microbacterium sp.]
MSGSATARRRGRGAQPEGPRATFRQLLPFLFEHKRTLIVVAVLSVIGAATSLVQPLLVGQVIEAVQSDTGIGILVWLLVGFVIVSSVISGFQHYLLQRTGTAVVYSSRRKLIARILHLPTSEFDARRTGDLVSRVGTDTTLLYAVLTQGLADAVGSAVLFLGALIAMLVIDPILLLLIVVVIGISVAVVVLLSGRIRTASTAQQEKVGELASGVERAVGSIRTIRASGATERETTAVSGLASDAYGIGVRIAKISSMVVPVSGIALQLSLLVVLGVGGFRVAAGAITIASLISFIMFLFLLVMPLATTFGAITSVNQALGALGRIQEVLDLPTESQDDEKIAASLPRETAAADAPAIEFRDVRFHYPANVVAARQAAAKEARTLLADAHLESAEDAAPAVQDHEVLRGVSFAVPQGSRVALVGPSGAGKSTILSLIERFYDPTGGSIRLHGHDARTYPRDELRAHFGYVEQDAPTLAGTLAENLRLASPEATDTDCERVLRAVNLGDVLERDPLGIEAPVGEDGVMLSGGERQRLAIARALLTDAPILLLDESTSSLDGVNEQRMREAIDAVSTDRTLIVIAHRLSTVVDSDLIVVLQDGVVVGQGTHAELVESTPLYRDLARHQLLT